MELTSGLFLFTSSLKRQTEPSDGWRDGRCSTTAQHVHDACVLLLLFCCISLHCGYINILISELQGFVCFHNCLRTLNIIYFAFNEKVHQILKCPEMNSRVVPWGYNHSSYPQRYLPSFSPKQWHAWVNEINISHLGKSLWQCGKLETNIFSCLKQRLKYLKTD